MYCDIRLRICTVNNDKGSAALEVSNSFFLEGGGGLGVMEERIFGTYYNF
jgi:hypothetical protein